MCLLVTQNKNSPVLPDHWLEDFYQSNEDGVGVMFAHHGELIIKKLLPNSAQELIQFYRENIQGRDCAFHLRMRTHGDIDLLNCHPYEVLNRAEHGIDLWLMHNGVLATGNQSDPRYSDTWHYINDYLKPILVTNPDFAFHPSFADLIGKHIGVSNKFVLMDNEGRQTVINQDAGVYWGGLWLSNTYAWTAPDKVRKTPVIGKKAKKQVQEKPKKFSYPSYKSYGYQNYGYETYPSYPSLWANEDPVTDYYKDVELNLDDLNYIIGEHKISVDQGLNFVEEFGLESFLDLVDYAISGQVDLPLFERMITDFQFARESLPHV